MTSIQGRKPLSFQEAMEMAQIDSSFAQPQRPTKIFMSRRPAWRPGQDLDVESVGLGVMRIERGAYGGWAFSMAPLAAARVVEAEDQAAGKYDIGTRRAIHSIQAAYPNPGLCDRPFVFDVSEVSSSRSLSTYHVDVTQPLNPSKEPSLFPLSDTLGPRGKSHISCVVTFKRPCVGKHDFQDLPPQVRYRDILSSREPAGWSHCPPVDIDIIKDRLPDAGPGEFPILEARKVDMAAYNDGKPISRRRELIMYRLLEPIPSDDVNAHIVAHMFEADRNILLMLGNHLGFGYTPNKVATLSFSFHVHVNADEAVMQGDGWWIKEVSWPKYSAGRMMIHCSIWSPEGKHVASAYQDGMLLQPSGAAGIKGKL